MLERKTLTEFHRNKSLKLTQLKNFPTSLFSPEQGKWLHIICMQCTFLLQRDTGVKHVLLEILDWEALSQMGSWWWLAPSANGQKPWLNLKQRVYVNFTHKMTWQPSTWQMLCRTQQNSEEGQKNVHSIYYYIKSTITLFYHF